MKKLILVIFLVTSLFSLDISEAVKLGLEKKSEFVDINNLNQADIKLDIRLVYLKYLKNRDSMYITQTAMKYMDKFKESKNIFVEKEKIIEADFLDSKSLLELIVKQKTEDINSVKKIDFSKLKSLSLEELVDKSSENLEEVNSLESELNVHDKKKSDSSWNADVSGEVIYGYETGKTRRGRNYRGNEVEIGVSIVLSKNSGYENDSTIEIAKKRRDLENKKINLKVDIKQQRDEYVKALKDYKKAKENIKKHDVKNLKSAKEVEKAYDSYMKKNEALYNVYRKYARLLHVLEKN